MRDMAWAPAQSRRARALQTAIRRTLAYADVFDYPLTSTELHRYLHDECATPQEVRSLLDAGIPGVEEHSGFHVLAGRLWIVAERRRRDAFSRPLLAHLGLYAKILRYLPFVRMAGLTGSLAMQNTDGRGDIDLLVIAVPGRVWLARAAVIGLVRLARVTGDVLCPNYILAESSLALDDASIYGAHELAQLVPFFGREVYSRLWSSNPQVAVLLPNARSWPMKEERAIPLASALQRGIEHLLGGALGDRLESWERRRKTDRLRGQERTCSTEIVLSADQCKGHFDRHRARVLQAYDERLVRVEDAQERAQRSRTADWSYA